jgi:hypothetical protein
VSRRRKTGFGPAALVTVVGVAVVWAAAVDGLWWAPLLAGFVIGVILRGARAIVTTAGLVAVLGWALPLAWQALHSPIGKVATVAAGILGLGTTRGPVVIVVTLALALLLGLAGAWVGAALRRLIVPPRPVL